MSRFLHLRGNTGVVLEFVDDKLKTLLLNTIAYIHIQFIFLNYVFIIIYNVISLLLILL